MIEITGKVISVGELTHFTKEYQKFDLREIIVEIKGEINQRVVLKLTNKLAKNPNVKFGDNKTFHILFRAVENKGRWFNNILCMKIEDAKKEIE